MVLENVVGGIIAIAVLVIVLVSAIPLTLLRVLLDLWDRIDGRPVAIRIILLLAFLVSAIVFFLMQRPLRLSPVENIKVIAASVISTIRGL